jgi:hypothetical protein
MNNLLAPINISLSKQDFTISKLNGKDYKSNIGNFSKHLSKYGYNIDSYTREFYYDLIPRCIESGDISDYRITGYWGTYIPLSKRYKSLQKRYNVLINRIRCIRDDVDNQYHTKYLEFHYWFDNTDMKFSDIIDRLEFFVKPGKGNWDGSIYRRLSDKFYDSSWAADNKLKYMSAVLQGELPVYNNKWTRKGQLQRGYSDTTRNEFFKQRPTIFRDVNFQRTQSAKAHTTHTDWSLNSVRCVEYWLRNGYSLDESIAKISNIQQNNSIQNIQNRLQCSRQEAIDVQKEIYNKRLDTFSKKSLDELKDIWRRQDSASYEYCLRKCNFDHTAAKLLFNDLVARRVAPFGRASKESLKIFIPLYKLLRIHGILREDIYFGVSGSNEYRLYDSINKKLRMYDFTILSKKLIIEYDGMFWHTNPEHIANDQYKDSLADGTGFTIYRIKSDDPNKLINLNKFLHEQLRITNPDWGTI